MSVECQVNVKSQSELDIGGRETCFHLISLQKMTIEAIDVVGKLQTEIESALCPHGFEVRPFLTGWYNQLVSDKFHLDYPEDTLAFVIISQPSMFEKAFLPFLSSHYKSGN